MSIVRYYVAINIVNGSMRILDVVGLFELNKQVSFAKILGNKTILVSPRRI